MEDLVREFLESFNLVRHLVEQELTKVARKYESYMQPLDDNWDREMIHEMSLAITDLLTAHSRQELNRNESRYKFEITHDPPNE